MSNTPAKVVLRGDIEIRDCARKSEGSFEPCYHLVDKDANIQIHLDRSSLRSLRRSAERACTELLGDTPAHEQDHFEQPTAPASVPVVLPIAEQEDDGPFDPLIRLLRARHMTPGQAAFFARYNRMPHAKDGRISQVVSEAYDANDPCALRVAERQWAEGEHEEALKAYANEAMIPNVLDGVNARAAQVTKRFEKALAKAEKRNRRERSHLRGFVKAALISGLTAATVLYGSTAWDALYSLLTN